MTLEPFNLEAVQEYYGKILKGNKDLQASACRCNGEVLPSSVKAALEEINTEVIEKFYGCGSPLPPMLEGCAVLDLGCGTGRDSFIAARLVGTAGKVIGVDMTQEQLTVGRKNMSAQMKKFGYVESNVEFRQGYIEDLQSIGIADNSVDVVISNCVINLSQDKKRVLSEIFRVLKPGGELLFSDVFTGRRVPHNFYNDPVLHGECLAGAMYREDFRRLMLSLGCRDFRFTNNRRIDLGNLEIEMKIGMVDFYSATVRAFKLSSLEDICEDYGQVAIYHGTIKDYPHFFDLDDHHHFIKDKPMLVCGNTASMLSETRYKTHFTVNGDRSIHFGAFDCGPSMVKFEQSSGSGGACC